MIIKCLILMIIKCLILMIIIMLRPYDHLVTMLSMVIMVIFLSYFEVDCDDRAAQHGHNLKLIVMISVCCSA